MVHWLADFYPRDYRTGKKKKVVVTGESGPKRAAREPAKGEGGKATHRLVLLQKRASQKGGGKRPNWREKSP